MASIADLARERINILHVVTNAAARIYLVEYQYSPVDHSPRTWHKVGITLHGWSDEEDYDGILQAVRQAKAELEA